METATPVQLRVNGRNLAETGNRMFRSYAQNQPPGPEMAKDMFPDDPDGNFYRASRYPWTADLSYRGTDPQVYINNGYIKATNSSENDWTDLVNLCYVMSNSPDATYVEDVSRVIDTDEWLRYFAI